MAGLLDGKSALITGGGGGIGRATALAFAREGARVAVADYAADTAAETVAMVNAAGGQAITLTGDVTRARDVKTMLDDTIVAYGRLDCAFNNAGIAGWQVEAAGKILDRRRVPARNDMVRPEFLRFVEFALARCKCRHVAAIGSGEFHGHVSEAPEAHDADLLPAAHFPAAQGRVGGDPGAQERRRPGRPPSRTPQTNRDPASSRSSIQSN